MSETLKSPEEQGFAINDLSQLEGQFSWRPKTEMLHGGRESFLAMMKGEIEKNGGLTLERLHELGIFKSGENRRPKSDLLDQQKNRQ